MLADPDTVFDDGVPANWLQHFWEIMDRHQANKARFFLFFVRSVGGAGREGGREGGREAFFDTVCYLGMSQGGRRRVIGRIVLVGSLFHF